jgi:hypothetical protein
MSAIASPKRRGPLLGQKPMLNEGVAGIAAFHVGSRAINRFDAKERSNAIGPLGEIHAFRNADLPNRNWNGARAGSDPGSRCRNEK